MSSAGSLTLQTFFSFSGELPFIIALSSYEPNEGLLYDFMILVPLFLFLVSILAKLKYEDKIAKHLETMDSEGTRQYSKEILAAWDNSLITLNDIDEYSSSLNNKYLQLIEETTILGKKKKRSQYETFVVYFRRSMGMVYYVLLVGTSFSVIIYVTIYSSTIAASASQISFLKNFTPFIVTIILNIINGATPTILQKLTEVEGWDSAQTVSNIVLLRLYISNLLNTLILAASYMVLADPFLLAERGSLRNSIGVKENGSSCRYDQAGSGLFVLVITTWFLNLAFQFLIPFTLKLFYKYVMKVYDEKKYKQEFIVAPMMIQKLNFLGLSFLALPFAPALYIFLPFLMFTSFKLEKMILKHYYYKPLRPWKGQKAGFLFTSLYLSTFIFIGLSVSSYFFISNSFVKSCDMQDNSIHLCQSDTFDSSTNICSVKTSSSYYDSYGKNDNYPLSLCQDACGPFVNNEDNLQPFHRVIDSYFVLKIIWYLCFSLPYIPWVGCVIFVVLLFLHLNTIDVMKIISFNKERNMQSQILSLEAERKKQIKIINKLKSIESAEESVKKLD
jgi:hypothetical protein